MLKEKMCNVLKGVAEETAKKSVNDASLWIMYQDDEPEEARRMFLKQEEKMFSVERISGGK